MQRWSSLSVYGKYMRKSIIVAVKQRFLKFSNLRNGLTVLSAYIIVFLYTYLNIIIYCLFNSIGS